MNKSQVFTTSRFFDETIRLLRAIDEEDIYSVEVSLDEGVVPAAVVQIREDDEYFFGVGMIDGAPKVAILDDSGKLLAKVKRYPARSSSGDFHGDCEKVLKGAIVPGWEVVSGWEVIDGLTSKSEADAKEILDPTLSIGGVDIQDLLTGLMEGPYSEPLRRAGRNISADLQLGEAGEASAALLIGTLIELGLGEGTQSERTLENPTFAAGSVAGCFLGAGEFSRRVAGLKFDIRGTEQKLVFCVTDDNIRLMLIGYPDGTAKQIVDSSDAEDLNMHQFGLTVKRLVEGEAVVNGWELHSVEGIAFELLFRGENK